MSPVFARAWPHLRTLLIAAHVVAVMLMALPAANGGMNRKSWRDPTVQAEFDAWHSRLGSIGVHVPRDEFEERLYRFTASFMEARKRVLEPFDPYYRYCGTNQVWQMFVAPHTHPGRLHIEIEREGVWSTVYVERSTEHVWLAHQFDHDRMRSALFRYSWRQFRRSYLQLVDWIAIRARQDFPGATRVRVQYYKARTPSAAEVRGGAIPEGKFEHVVVRDLDLATTAQP